MSALIDDRLMATLDSHFPEICKIQSLAETVDDDGQVVEEWTDRYASVPCLSTPLKGKEIKKSNQTYVVATTSIALQGLYSDIVESDRVIVGGTTYNILLVEQILGTMTRLSCEVVRV